MVTHYLSLLTSPTLFLASHVCILIQVVCQPAYGGINCTIDNILLKLGIEVTYIKGNSIEEFKQAIKENTKASVYSMWDE